MGKGVAKSFRQRYPEMFAEYKRLCDRKELRIGTLHLWRGADHWVLNFPTKTTWRLPSRLDYLEQGLQKLVASYEELGITSISFPPLGCGNGNLDWNDVKPVVERYLLDLTIPVYIHDLHVGAGFFVPEHLEASAPAGDLPTLQSDLGRLTAEGTSHFTTLDRNEPFQAVLLGNGDLQVKADGQDETIPQDEIEAAWAELQTGLLTTGSNRESPRPHDQYLFPVLARLPYVQLASVRHLHRGQYQTGHGLFLRRRAAPARFAAHREQVQRRLWP